MEAPKELPADTKFHALPQTQLGIYAIFLPPGYAAPENRDKKYPLVLIIHGHGSTEIRHGQMADTFGRKDVIYLAPRAPYPHEEVFIVLDTPGWTAMPTVPEQLWEIKEGDADYIDVDRLYTDWIASTVQDVRRRYRVSDQRIVIYGHSQGATYAYLFALHHPELVKAYFAFAGYYSFIEDKTIGEGAQILKQNGVFSSLLHNRPDPMVEVAETESLAAYFKQHGVRHEALISAAGDHYLTDDERKRATKFIRDWCCGAHAGETRTLPPLEPKSATDPRADP
jgi:predicted esterase